jgi:hypothetical protein
MITLSGGRSTSGAERSSIVLILDVLDATRRASLLTAPG